MFPNPPYPRYSWSLTHHIGVVNERNLYQTMYAAATYADSPDPPMEINNYLNNNNLLTRNIRDGVPATWRDYQQILAELGLIISTHLNQHRITPTPLGLAFLDHVITYPELITLQALRYQYPNGYKTVVSAAQRRKLRGTVYESVQGLATIQHNAGVRIRPTVLLWQILRELDRRGADPSLSVIEVAAYAMRCATHEDTIPCADAIITSRARGLVLPITGDGRNASDWMDLLMNTAIFGGRRDSHLTIAALQDDEIKQVDDLCYQLANPTTFWQPPRIVDKAGRVSWFVTFGELDLGISLFSKDSETDKDALAEEEDQSEETSTEQVRQIQLREYRPETYLDMENPEYAPSGYTVESSYSADLARRAARLHDQMVVLIGNTCRSKPGAQVFDDPSSVDLLVKYQDTEFLVEVKSVTPRNLVKRVRYALGQVIHYDYLRSKESDSSRRKVVALAAQVPPESWCIPFFNRHLDMDLLSLHGSNLRVDSLSSVAQELFTADIQPSTLPLYP